MATIISAGTTPPSDFPALPQQPEEVPGGGSGSVSTVTVIGNDGISANVANPTTTPQITLSLGSIDVDSLVSDGPITAPNITGNAATATKLATARNINGVAFDGTANITVPSVDTATPRVSINDIIERRNFAAAG